MNAETSEKTPAEAFWYDKNNPIDPYTLIDIWVQDMGEDRQSVFEALHKLFKADDSCISISKRYLEQLITNGGTDYWEVSNYGKLEHFCTAAFQPIFIPVDDSPLFPETEPAVSIDLPCLVKILRQGGYRYPPRLNPPEPITKTTGSDVFPGDEWLTGTTNPTDLMKIMCRAHYFVQHEDNGSYQNKSIADQVEALSRKYTIGSKQAEKIHKVTSTKEQIAGPTKLMATVVEAHNFFFNTEEGKSFQLQGDRKMVLRRNRFGLSKGDAESVLGIITTSKMQKSGFK